MMDVYSKITGCTSLCLSTSLCIRHHNAYNGAVADPSDCRAPMHDLCRIHNVTKSTCKVASTVITSGYTIQNGAHFMIKDQLMGPLRAKYVFHFIQQWPDQIFHNLDSFFFAHTKLQEKVVPWDCIHRLVPRYKWQLFNRSSCILEKLFKDLCHRGLLERCYSL
jgi:hypothetical protein